VSSTKGLTPLRIARPGRRSYGCPKRKSVFPMRLANLSATKSWNRKESPKSHCEDSDYQRQRVDAHPAQIIRLYGNDVEVGKRAFSVAITPPAP